MGHGAGFDVVDKNGQAQLGGGGDSVHAEYVGSNYSIRS